MPSDTSPSTNPTERRRQHVVIAGVAGVAVLTAGTIAYWPGVGSRVAATVAGSSWAAGSDTGKAPVSQPWDPTAATTKPGATASDAERASRSEARTSLAPTADPSSTPAGTPSGAPSSAAPGSAAPIAPVRPSTAQPRPLVGHGTASSSPAPASSAPSTPSPAAPSGTSTTSATPTPSGTPSTTAPTVSTPSSTPTTDSTPLLSPTATPTGIPTPTPTKTKHHCILFVFCS
ncbi:hypothetical protein [Terrabacter sp. NPDC080008]|uniref:hypothetical protein n=1 Tax=Terrabacter sp. NPDC080008 TaxID=3155176 RepID=UPI00344E3DAD